MIIGSASSKAPSARPVPPLPAEMARSAKVAAPLNPILAPGFKISSKVALPKRIGSTPEPALDASSSRAVNFFSPNSLTPLSSICFLAALPAVSKRLPM